MVAFDAVGPSSSGAKLSPGAGPLTWSHTVSGTNTLLLVWIGCDDDATTVSAVTYGGVAMTKVGATIHTNADASGWLMLYKLVGAAAGTATVSVTFSASSIIEAASMSFNGADQSTGIATPATPTTGFTATATMAVASNTNGNIIASAACAGSVFSSATAPSTSRFNVVSGAGSNGGGWLAGATSPATGSSVTTAWTISASDFWAVIAVEVLSAGAATSALAGLASATGTAPTPTVAGAGLNSAVAHATAAAVLPGGYGTWGTPEYAEGGP
jgi:hypothetical protein